MPSKPQLILFGIDGATWDVALPYIEAGRLPALRRVVEQGAWGTLLSIHPPVTACCWPTILTGTNPGQHGMFDFFAVRPGTYDSRPVMLLDWRRPPLWQLLSRLGVTVGVFNVPITFPVQPINGFIVSGEMGTPRLDARMFYPEQVRDIIRPQLRCYELEPIAGRSRRDVRRLVRQIAVRNEAALALVERVPTDVLVVVLNYVDHAEHLFWGERFSSLDARAGSHNPVLLAYEGADRLLRSLQELAGDQCTTIVLSDHGVGPVEGYLDLARLLASLGYLRFTRATPGDPAAMYTGRVPQALRPLGAALLKRLPRSLTALVRRLDSPASIDYPATVVFPRGNCGALHVNLSGREPHGRVRPADLARVCHELTSSLREIEGFEGEQLFEVYSNEELYSGLWADLGPNLVAVPQRYAVQVVSATPPWCHWLVSRADGRAIGLPQFTRQASHRLEGMIAAMGPGLTPGHMPNAAQLVDVAPTVMSLLGLPVPRHMDGHVMPWARVPASAPPATPPPQPVTASPQTADAYTPAEETTVANRLRRIGYSA